MTNPVNFRWVCFCRSATIKLKKTRGDHPQHIAIFFMSGTAAISKPRIRQHHKPYGSLESAKLHSTLSASVYLLSFSGCANAYASSLKSSHACLLRHFVLCFSVNQNSHIGQLAHRSFLPLYNDNNIFTIIT